MNPLTILRTVLFVLLMAAVAAGKDKTPPVYQQGTITGWSNQYQYERKAFGVRSKYYELKAAGIVYEIDGCGPFQIGQAVGYRVEEGAEDWDNEKIYIRGENGKKEEKCNVDSARSVEETKTDASSGAVPSSTR
jgi:hypothetical protein